MVQYLSLKSGYTLRGMICIARLQYQYIQFLFVFVILRVNFIYLFLFLVMGERKVENACKFKLKFESFPESEQPFILKQGKMDKESNSNYWVDFSIWF